MNSNKSMIGIALIGLAATMGLIVGHDKHAVLDGATYLR